MSDAGRWRGLSALVVDAVTHGSVAIERIQKETADRAFTVLERVTPLAPAAEVVRAVHDASVTGVHRVIRGVARAAGFAVDAALRVAERADRRDG
jgi:hydrogenase maturation factor